MSLTEKQKKLEEIRKQAKEDFYFFCKEILQYKEMEEIPHRDFCEFVTGSPKDKKLILLPRGAFKSSIVTIGRSLDKLIKNPNERIMISSETVGQSITYLHSIKNHIEGNPYFKMLFGELKSENMWREDRIIINSRTKTGVKEPSITASGMGVTKVGMHYDTIILDDIVSNNNVNTPEQIKKVIDHYRLLLSILDPGGELIVIGTRYSYADLYGHIMEHEKDNFDIYVKSAIDDKGKMYFPSRLTKEFLISQKKAQGSYIFNAQYMNNPVDQDNAVFKQEWIQYYEKEPQRLRHFIVCDPASSVSKDSDYTGLIVVGIDYDSNIFVVETHQIKVTIFELVSKVFDLAEKYNVGQEGCFALETNSNQQTYKYAFFDEMNRRNIFFALKELKPDSRVSKERRIMALQPWFENGKIWLKRNQIELLDELVRFPRTKHDDMVDALSDILQVMIPGEEPEAKGKFDDCKISENEKNVWKANDKERDLYQRRRVRRTRLAI